MAAILLLFLFAFSFSSGYKILDDDLTTPALALPTEYYLKAEKIDLIGNLREPLELWYSMELNRSRISVDEGAVTRYYRWNYTDSQDGVAITISPMTSESMQNEMTCIISPISEENGDLVAFPEDDSYVYARTTEHEGREVDVWEDLYEDEDEKIENILYTYQGSRDVDVPVQIVQKKYLRGKGFLKKHVIYNYFDYNPIICDEDLETDQDYECRLASDDFHGTMKSLHPSFDGDLDVAFDSFKKHHGKVYKEDEEHETRKQIFHKNWKFVEERNRKNLGYKLALNHLSDLTDAEMRLMSGTRRSSPPTAPVAFPHSAEEVEEIVQELPEEFDMRQEGYITPVKDQGICGSCWAFAATAAVEGALSRDLGRNLVLSEQSLVDCSWGKIASRDNAGCSGGQPQDALMHVVKHGIPLDGEYGGYLAQNGYCHLSDVAEVYKIRGFALATPRSISAVKVALHKYGPVVASIQVNNAFEHYSSGVFYDSECIEDNTDHAVTIVGYGTRAGADYWIVKNSWGEGWGEDGYLLLSTTNNNCFLLDEPYYPIV